MLQAIPARSYLRGMNDSYRPTFVLLRRL